MPKVLVIVGPTASGKSDLAVRLAKKFKGEIISADSRQVYKWLDVGTGKITKREMRGVPHHLLDVADPRKSFTASDYKKLAEEKVRYIARNNKLPIVVGGTGFYIDALTGAAALPDVPPNQKLRERLGKKSNEVLFKMLRQKDPKRAETIDMHNKVRLIRALEIVGALGKVPRVKSKIDKNLIYIGLMPDHLDERIRARLDKRLPGIIQEVKKLLKLRKLTYKRMHELGLEYRYVSLYLQGKLAKQEMTKQLFTAIRQYSKRQYAWFKRNKRIKWFTLSGVEGFKPGQYGEIEKYARIALKGD